MSIGNWKKYSSLKNFETDELHPIKVGIILLAVFQYMAFFWFVNGFSDEWQIRSLIDPTMFLVVGFILLIFFKKLKNWVLIQTPNPRSLARLIAVYLCFSFLMPLGLFLAYFLSKFVFFPLEITSTTIFKIVMALWFIFYVIYFFRDRIKGWREDFRK